NAAEASNSALTTEASLSLRDYSSQLFAIDLSGILFILAAFAHVLAIEENHLVPAETVKLFRSGRNRMAILGLLMAITIAPQFWTWQLFNAPLRLYMWYIPLVSYWVGRALRPETRTYRLK